MKSLIGIAILGFIGWKAYAYFSADNAPAFDATAVESLSPNDLNRLFDDLNIDVKSLPKIGPETRKCYEDFMQEVSTCKTTRCSEREAKRLMRCAKG